MAERVTKPFARATKVANTMLVVDIALTLALLRLAGVRGLASTALALLPPAWSALVLALLLTWVKPIRASLPPEFPSNLTYPLLSSTLLFSIAVLTCGKSPSIVALESEASTLTIWTNYPFAVISAIAKIVAMTVWVFAAKRLAVKPHPGRPRTE